MPHIATVPPSRAEGELARLYAQIEAAMGRIPGAFELYSLSPELLRQQWEFIGYYLQHPTLSGPFLAFLRLSVSSELRCDYCIGLNGGLLVNLFGWTPEQLAAARRNPADAPLSKKEQALLRYCLEAMRCTGQVAPSELASLRAVGWSDRDVLDAVLHAARSVAADILFNTFGLQQESFA